MTKSAWPRPWSGFSPILICGSNGAAGRARLLGPTSHWTQFGTSMNNFIGSCWPRRDGRSGARRGLPCLYHHESSATGSLSASSWRGSKPHPDAMPLLKEQGVPYRVINLTRHRRPDSEEVYYPRSAAQVVRLLFRLPYDVAHLHVGGDLSHRLLALGLV